ncbi:MAG: energy transducer TonB [Nibricoccus sp.]
MLNFKTSALALVFSLLASTFITPTAVAAEGPDFDVKPMPVKTPPPEYPAELRRDNVSGVVALRVEIDETGAVTNCAVSKSTNNGFDAPAIQAVKNWKFKPAQKAGTPVKVSLVIPIKFSLED